MALEDGGGKNGDSPCSTIESLPRKNRSQSAGESPLVDENSPSIRICYSSCVTQGKFVVIADGNGGALHAVPAGPTARRGRRDRTRGFLWRLRGLIRHSS